MRPHILLLSITSLASARISTDKSSLPEGAWMPKELGRFHIPHAGFIEAYDNEEGKKDLYITTFNPALPYFHDPVFMIPNPGEKLNSVSGWANEVVTLGVKASAYWPNFPVKMNKEVVGFEGVVQTSGFLVPGKNTGKLELYNRNDNARGPIDIAAGQDKDWSYHWVIWKDVDDDGLIDALTARFRVPGFIEGGDPISQLLWFKNPGGDAPSTGHEWPWQSSILLTGGPDVYIEETIQEACNPDCVEYSIIVTGELWNERIMLYYVENTPGAWSDPSNIRSVVVDAAPGQPFEARFGDANNDGKVEIFASAYNQDPDNKTGNFWMYQEQDDGTWERIALASGFIAHPYLFGSSMAPGKSLLFWPSDEYKNTPTAFGPQPKPWIAISGDDDGVHYIMFPKSEDPENWEYDIQVSLVFFDAFPIFHLVSQVMVDTEATTAGILAIDIIDLEREQCSGYLPS